MKRKPRDEADSLPSLMWLTDYTVKDTGMPRLPGCPSSPDLQDTTPSFAAPCSPLAGDPACMGSPHAPCKPISSSTSKTTHHTVTAPPPLAEDIDYRTNPYIKPPYSYANLICMAMEASGEPKITLSAIYKWITDNFCYYRHADPTWQVGDLETSCLVPSPHRAGKGFPQPPLVRQECWVPLGGEWHRQMVGKGHNGKAVGCAEMPWPRGQWREGAIKGERLGPSGEHRGTSWAAGSCDCSWLWGEGISVPGFTFLELLQGPESLRAEHT